MAYTTLRLFLDGMLSMMALYSLLSYFQQRKAIYWQYALYIACMVLDLRLSDFGYAQPDYQPGAFYPETLVESLAYIFYIRFAILLINPAEKDPFIDRMMKRLVGAFVVALALDTALLLLDVAVPVRSAVYMATRLAISAFGLYLVPRIFRLRDAVVSYFIAGTLLLLIGSIAALLSNYLSPGVSSKLTNAFMFPVAFLQVGVVGEVLCFTLGMSLRNRQTEREKIRYQAQLIEQLRENEQKQAKLQRIRDDIARDLHDDVGSDLSSISLLSQAATRQVEKQPDAARATLTTIGQMARQVVVTMREIVWSLNSAQTSVDSFGFRLRETAETLFEHHPTRLHIDFPAADSDWVLPAEGRRDLFLIVKEVLHNVVRHAGAANVFVAMWVEQNRLYLTIRDDGRGFVEPTGSSSAGNGLRNMRQRADALGGQLTLVSRPGEGTTVAFRCPLTVQEGVMEY